MAIKIIKKYYWLIFLLLPFIIGASTCWWFTAFVGEDSENSPTEACLDVFPTPTQAIPLIPQGNPPPGDPIIQGGEPVGNPPPEELPQPPPGMYTITLSAYNPSLPCSGYSLSPSPTAQVPPGGSLVVTVNCGNCVWYEVKLDGNPYGSSYSCPSSTPSITSFFLPNISADHTLEFIFEGGA